jgi:translocator protein
VNRDLLRQIVIPLATLATLVANGLANALPLNGQTTGEISDRFPVLFTPAGYVFSIWGLIYVGLIAFSIYQALPAQRQDQRLRRIGFLFVLGSAANIAWIVLWHYERFPATLAAMLVLLGSLLGIYLRLEIGRAPAGRAERALAWAPFSLYLGWVTVATVANVSVVLVEAGWDGLGLAPAVWTVAVLAVALAIGAGVSLRRGDAIFPLVLTWAFAGIAVRQQGGEALVAWAALAGAVAAAALALAGWATSRRLRPAAGPA